MTNPLLRACAAFAGLLACGFARAQAPAPVTIALPGTAPAYATTYLAADLDLFGDRGLKVALVEAAGTGDALIPGDAGWTLATGGDFARAVARGQRLLGLANLVERPQLELVLKKTFADQGKFVATSPVAARGKLLRGRALGVEALGGPHEGWARLVARKAGLDADKDLRFLALPGAAFAAAMAEGKIDGFVAAAPWSFTATRDGAGVVLASALAEDAPEIMPFAWSVLVTRPETCQTRKSVCENMVKAYVEATRVLRDEPLRTTLALKRRFPGLSDDAFRATIESIRRSTPIFPAVTAQGLANAEAFAVASGLLKAGDALKSFDGLFTAEYIR
jgi:ABC-type nitrate/sulfonate/bicarbonate transport system substrate-binding protein